MTMMVICDALMVAVVVAMFMKTTATTTDGDVDDADENVDGDKDDGSVCSACVRVFATNILVLPSWLCARR